MRGVQVHGSATEQAIAGQRTALNVAGIQVENLARGMTLAPPDVLEVTQRIDVQLSLLKDARPMKNRARVHLHVFTVETIAGVTFHQGAPNEAEANQLKPGSTAFARLRTASPILVLPGDHLILRQFSPVVTIGGAVVLDAFPLRRQKREATLKFLETMAGGSLAENLLARIHRRASDGLSIADAVREMGLRPAVQQKQVIQAGELLVASASFTVARERTAAILDAFHKVNPLVAGISKEELREKLSLQPVVLEALLTEMARERKVEFAGEQVKLVGRGVALKDDESKAKQEIEKVFSSAGLKVPALKEVLASLTVDKSRAQKLVTLLLRDRILVKLTDDLVFHQTAIQGLRKILAEYKTKSQKIDVATFKDLTGISRKYAIPLLEYLDRERVTRRVGDERVIL